MTGAIIGDIAGSLYEFAGNKDPLVPLFPKGCSFTDDSILALATASAILEGGDYGIAYRKFGFKHPDPMGAYGISFREWLSATKPKPYNSWGNGAAMRVIPVGWAFETLEQVLEQARQSAEVTHNHVEGVRGAQATAAAVWMAKQGAGKKEIRRYIADYFHYDLSRTVEGIRGDYGFDESCQGTVPEALIAFLDTADFESAIRAAVSLGGDADTIGCITGGVAHAFYKHLPAEMIGNACSMLSPDLLQVLEQFNSRFCT
jgi:ADP-ribosylglycohydrolase